MSELITQPETGSFSGAYAPGVLDQYSTAELDQIGKLQEAAVTVSAAEANYRYETIRLKLMLDGEDRADGLTVPNQHQSSRFWDGARAGHFGDRLQEMADNGNRKTVFMWVKANEAAAVLLGERVTEVTRSLPLESAKELGINPSTLEIYASFDADLREVADFYYEATGELKADMLKSIRTVCNNFADRKDELLQGIASKTIKYPSHVDELIDEWIAQRRELKAVKRAEEHAARLAEAEAAEEKLVDYKPDAPKDEHVGDQEDTSGRGEISERKSPSRKWYDTDSGQMKVKEVVGDLAQPLPDLLTGLTGLNKKLMDQAEHSGVMHNYAEFWAGYDRFAMSPAAAQRTWGKAGRLERMRKLRGLLIEVQQRIDVYIQNTTPPKNIEYPET
tara:strand:+ start:1569 stop:2738 length:1170 start_codon:yes stop_codon:yes gene_type:complete